MEPYRRVLTHSVVRLAILFSFGFFSSAVVAEMRIHGLFQGVYEGQQHLELTTASVGDCDAGEEFNVWDKIVGSQFLLRKTSEEKGLISGRVLEIIPRPGQSPLLVPSGEYHFMEYGKDTLLIIAFFTATQSPRAYVMWWVEHVFYVCFFNKP